MDLTTRYMGLTLSHPLMVGSGPVADSVDSARRAEDAGAAAIVMRSLFEEQVRAETRAALEAAELHAEAFAEAPNYLPNPAGFVLGPESYLSQIVALKRALSIPVIASLNGCTPGGWLSYATLMEQAGADALELNLYDVPTDALDSSVDIESRQVEMVRVVREAVRIPIAVKISPFYAALPHFAMKLTAAGADGLVLFNRFFEPDIDLERFEVTSHMHLSVRSELRLRLRWTAILSARIDASFALTGGAHQVQDVVKGLICGADVIQIVSGVLARGPATLNHLRNSLAEWLEANEYESLDQMRGSMNYDRCPDPAWLERANYLQMIRTWCPYRGPEMESAGGVQRAFNASGVA